MIGKMNTYSDQLTALGLTVHSSREEIDARVQAVMDHPSLSLTAKGLYALLVEQPGQVVNPFEDLLVPAELVSAAIEELIGAGLVMRA